jgi:hypothetical protein
VKLPNSQDLVDVIFAEKNRLDYNNYVAAKRCNVTSCVCEANARNVFAGSGVVYEKSIYSTGVYNSTTVSYYASDTAATSWGPANSLGHVNNATGVVTRAGPQMSIFRILPLTDNTFLLFYTTYTNPRDQIYVSRCFDVTCGTNSTSAVPLSKPRSISLTRTLLSSFLATWGLNATDNIPAGTSSSVIHKWGVTLSSDGFPVILVQHKTVGCSSIRYQLTTIYCPNNNCSSANVIRTAVGTTDACNPTGGVCAGASDAFNVITPPGQNPVGSFFNSSAGCTQHAIYCKNAACSQAAFENLEITIARVIPAHTGGVVINSLLNFGGQLSYYSWYCLSANRGNCTKNKVTLPVSFGSLGAIGNGGYVFYSNRTYYSFGQSAFGFNGPMIMADVSDEINAATPAPAPVAPPVAPAPVAPAPVAAAPKAPSPVAPAPVAPAPVAPAPVAPAPIAPAPVAPAPIVPAPVAPSPVAATPVAPSPVAPAPRATPAASPVDSAPAMPSPVSAPVSDASPVSAPESVSASPSAPTPAVAPLADSTPATSPSISPVSAPSNTTTGAPTSSQVSPAAPLQQIGLAAALFILLPLFF